MHDWCGSSGWGGLSIVMLGFVFYYKCGGPVRSYCQNLSFREQQQQGVVDGRYINYDCVLPIGRAYTILVAQVCPTLTFTDFNPSPILPGTIASGGLLTAAG